MSGNSNNTGLRTIWSPILRRIRLWSHSSRERIKRRPDFPSEALCAAKDDDDVFGRNDLAAATHPSENPLSEMTKQSTEGPGESPRESDHHKSAKDSSYYSNDKVSSSIQRKLGQCKSQDATIIATSCSKEEVIDSRGDKLQSKGRPLQLVVAHILLIYKEYLLIR